MRNINNGGKSYSPFGMIMPGRKFESEVGYRYGFNGKENDIEVKGVGNQQDYGMRIYDPRVGKFLSVDPLTKDYPWNSPYAFAENDVIRSTDMDGMERVITLFNPFNMQPVVICLGCGIREAADNYIGGLAQKSMVENQQASYNNDYVPKSVQQKVENVKTIDANAKIIKGVAQTTKISVETSFDIASNIVPVGEALELGVNSVKQLSRLRLATKVYNEVGITGRRLADHIKYYDFEKQVYKQTFEEGTEFVQFRRKGFEGSGGDYYAPLGTKPQEIGLDPNDVAETYKVTLNTKVEGLVSSHKRNTELYYDASRRSTGGGTQIYSDKIKESGNATFTKISTSQQ